MIGILKASTDSIHFWGFEKASQKGSQKATSVVASVIIVMQNIETKINWLSNSIIPFSKESFELKSFCSNTWSKYISLQISKW